MAERKRILINSYYFSPYRGGEAAVGWNIATRLAEKYDVTVCYGDLTQDQPQRQDLARWMATNPLPAHLHLEYIAPTTPMLRLERWHRKPLLWSLWYQAYRLWQRAAFQRALELHQQQPFDLVHQLTMIGYREPGFLWQLPAPFVWGPINGADCIPMQYYPMLGRASIGVFLRDLVNRIQMRLPGRYRQACRHARHIWTVTAADQQMVTRVWHGQCEPMIETGAMPVRTRNPEERSPTAPLQIVWSGLFLPRKALPLLLKALSGLPTAQWQLHVLGSGACAAAWRALARKLNIDSAIQWHGLVERSTALDIMSRADVLVHTSLKEGTPHVVLEALACGLPVICHDVCGMGTAVDARSGIKVAMTSPCDSIAGFQQALASLIQDRTLLHRLSQGAQARAAELSWDHVVDRISTVYDRIMVSHK